MINTAQDMQNLFDNMVIRQDVVDTLGNVIIQDVPGLITKRANQIIAGKDEYLPIAHHYPNPGFKWWCVGVIHLMECELDFKRYLGNGQVLNRITSIVPAGRGPFNSFYDGAIDALDLQNVNGRDMSSIGAVLLFLEGYNGFGYERWHDMNSPYVWSGSEYYEKGKYIADGHFDTEAVSNQIGVALIIKKLSDLGELN